MQCKCRCPICDPESPLTVQERRVARRLCEGIKPCDIAQDLKISRRSVYKLTHSIGLKLACPTTKVGIVAFIVFQTPVTD